MSLIRAWNEVLQGAENGSSVWNSALDSLQKHFWKPKPLKTKIGASLKGCKHRQKPSMTIQRFIPQSVLRVCRAFTPEMTVRVPGDGSIQENVTLLGRLWCFLPQSVMWTVVVSKFTCYSLENFTIWSIAFSLQRNNANRQIIIFSAYQKWCALLSALARSDIKSTESN